MLSIHLYTLLYAVNPCVWTIESRRAGFYMTNCFISTGVMVEVDQVQAEHKYGYLIGHNLFKCLCFL